jgi:hypothetical protein
VVALRCPLSGAELRIMALVTHSAPSPSPLEVALAKAPGALCDDAQTAVLASVQMVVSADEGSMSCSMQYNLLGHKERIGFWTTADKF